MKNVLVVFSVLLNVGFLGWIVFDDVLDMEVDDYFVAEGDSDDATLTELEKKYGVSQGLIEDTGEALTQCSSNFICMMAVQFVYYNGLLESLNVFEGDVYACKGQNAPITMFVPELEEDMSGFSCAKFTKKYRGLSMDAIQSDVEGDFSTWEKVVE